MFCKGGNFDIGSMWETIRDYYFDDMGMDCFEGLSEPARDALIAAADKRWANEPNRQAKLVG